MRALITGCGGFAGGHLARELVSEPGWQVWGTVYAPGEAERVGLEGVNLLQADLRDPAAVRHTVAAADPDVLFHLAGQAFVPASWTDPWETFETNVRMQLNVLEAVAAGGRATRVVAVTSNEIYGAVPEADLPVSELAPLAPLSPYATSKAAQDLLAAQYARVPGVDVVRVRPFTHIGPGQDPRFVAASFARQVAAAEAGQQTPEIRVGNLEAERDFTDVRDMVRGYRLAAEKGSSGAVWNLGAGVARPVRAILDYLVAAARVPLRVVEDSALLRPSDVPRTLCDARRAREDLGWAPRIPFEQTMADVLDDWRQRVRSEVCPQP